MCSAISHEPSSELAAALSEDTGKPISVRTARRRLMETGLEGCEAKIRPWLSEENKKQRLKWAVRY